MFLVGFAHTMSQSAVWSRRGSVKNDSYNFMGMIAGRCCCKIHPAVTQYATEQIVISQVQALCSR